LRQRPSNQRVAGSPSNTGSTTSTCVSTATTQAPASTTACERCQQATASTTELGEIATAYFKRFTTKTKDADTTYGIYDKGGKFYIGDTEIRIQGDDIIVGDRVYEGTPGLWELVVSKTPSDEIYTLSDKERYIDILTSTNALRRNNDPNESYPKSSRSPKWTNLLRPIWSKYSRASKPARTYRLVS
jgi:hypothetical protein